MANRFADFGDVFTVIDGNVAFCNVCSENILFRSKRQKLQSHVDTQKHLHNVNGTSQREFFEDICEAFISANIPLKKLNNPRLREFLKKYTGRNIPDESTIRKYYVSPQYEKAISTIKSKISDNYIWMSADETTDIKGRCVVNVIVGILNPQTLHEPYLISTEFRSTVNAEEIFEIIKNAMVEGASSPDKLLLFISDAAADKLLQQQFLNVLHLTCFAHPAHRICEFIREKFPDVNTLISTFKKNC